MKKIAKDKSALRTTILNAAKETFEERGLDSLSIRAIARKIDHSVGTIYLYFKSKSDLIEALKSEGFLILLQKINTLPSCANAIQTLQQICSAYIEFALSHHSYYELMFSSYMISGEATAQVLHSKSCAFTDKLLPIVETCIIEERLRFYDKYKATVIITGLLHGLVSVFVASHPFSIAQKPIIIGPEECFDTFLDAVKKKFDYK